MKETLMELLQQEQEKKALLQLLDCNRKTTPFGLMLTEADAKLLLSQRKAALRQQHRLEFGEGIIPALIDAFCDSAYITQETYVETLAELQDIFYEYKNESLDLLTDSELLSFMAQQFESVCFGDVEYLRSTCLERFCRAIRQSKPVLEKERDEYSLSEGGNPYENLGEEVQWDKDLFLQALLDLF
ncbi:DUF6323 family protein [Anaerotignum sp.]